METIQLRDWRERIHRELTGNILPFWFRIEKPGGGYVPEMRDDLSPVPGSPVSLILVSRLMWTYARAYRVTREQSHLDVATRAGDYLEAHFRDPADGGYVWSLGENETPLETKKQTYGQAFVVYALAEYHLATGDTVALRRAMDLFALLEEHCWKPGHDGYWEAHGRHWVPVDDVRLSSKDYNAPLTMNTHLHLVEAYANLLRATGDARVEAGCRRVLRIIRQHILRQDIPVQGLFYDADWNLLTREISPGHDIEASWLLWEAAEILKDEDLLQSLKPEVLAMAVFTLANGVGAHGGVLDEYEEGHKAGLGTNWWPQAEGAVGFLNAYQLTGEQRFLDASLAVWKYIETFIVDRVHGEWIAGRNADGAPLDRSKTGPWKACYHNGRACIELMERIDKLLHS